VSDIKHMPIAEFRAEGWLQEINRRLLHPAGLALEVTIDDDTGEEHISGVWDYRDDPEGIAYADDGDYAPDPGKARAVDRALAAKRPGRETALGYFIQPIRRDGGQP
jgi:hypothetical protein